LGADGVCGLDDAGSGGSESVSATLQAEGCPPDLRCAGSLDHGEDLCQRQRRDRSNGVAGGRIEGLESTHGATVAVQKFIHRKLARLTLDGKRF
jgi:hypothetical protein